MAPATQQQHPLTIESYGVRRTFTQAPQRVVAMGQHETELLLAGAGKICRRNLSLVRQTRIRWLMPEKLPGLRITPPL